LRWLLEGAQVGDGPCRKEREYDHRGRDRDLAGHPRTGPWDGPDDGAQQSRLEVGRKGCLRTHGCGVRLQPALGLLLGDHD
jgi:hypothetical protein